MLLFVLRLDFVCDEKRKRIAIFLKRTKMAIVNETDIGTVSKATVRETSERQGGAHNYGLFPAHRYHLDLNCLVVDVNVKRYSDSQPSKVCSVNSNSQPSKAYSVKQR